MKVEKLYQAKQEAERFLKKVEELEKDIGKSSSPYLYGSKFTGAVKRASMDLTRSLADLRRSDY